MFIVYQNPDLFKAFRKIIFRSKVKSLVKSFLRIISTFRDKFPLLW